jgi:FtsP/CotA-like multicopper oxidase with cupredoxin domain
MKIKHHLVTYCCLCSLLWVAGCDSGNRRNTTSNSIVQPEVRESINGLLSTTLEAVVAPNTIVDPITGLETSIETTTFEGGLIGPTLRVKPGDRLEISIVNNLPANPEQARQGAFPHQPHTINLHTHGLMVTPQGIGDNPFRQMTPGTTNPFAVDIPDFHPAGTFWYHPHKHGSVAFQFFGGMSGTLIIDGGEGTIDALPEIAAAADIVMAFQGIRVDAEGKVPWLNTQATQFGRGGAYGTYADTSLFLTTNGQHAPAHHMRPGEVQRWRLLNAASGLTLILALEQTQLNLIALDGISLPEVFTLPVGSPLVLGAGSRADVMVRAPAPGTYLLQAIDPDAAPYSVSPQGVAPDTRTVHISGDLPIPTYPVTLAQIIIEGEALEMDIPTGPLPDRGEPISREALLAAVPDKTRRVAFEICGQRGPMANPANRLPSCEFYFDRYDAEYWGGLPFNSLLMMRDDEDAGESTDLSNPHAPRDNYQKEGLFSHHRPLFDDILGDTIEEWTVINRNFSDHSFHIHQNPFLLTHINGEPLPVPEWRDTILVPRAVGDDVNINNATHGTVTFRTYIHPDFLGRILMHCHVLTHEDFGMMQMLELKPGPQSQR